MTAAGEGGDRPRAKRARGLLDAQDVLALTQRLHDERERITQARVSEEQKGRWRTRLQGIADNAASDLSRAVAQLDRLSAELDRVLES